MRRALFALVFGALCCGAAAVVASIKPEPTQAEFRERESGGSDTIN